MSNILNSIPCFAALTTAEETMLADASRILRKKAGELLVSAGDEVSRYYHVLKGEVIMYFLKPNGKRFIVRTYGAGALFFLSYALAQTRFVGYLEALEDVELIAVPAEQTRRLLKVNPLFAQSLLNCLVNDNLNFVNAVSGFLIDGRARFCRSLFNRVLEAGERCDEGIRVELGEPKSRLAARLDMSPETLSRMFAQMKEEGVIDVVDSVVVVRKVRELVRISEGL